MRRPPTILSKDEVIKLCDDKHNFIVNAIHYSIKLYLHSSDYFSYQGITQKVRV
ncbi:MAG: hypothetical protein RLZZ546_687 [Bacteroidota bacterium]|jgi:hypothetical protein